MQLQDDIVINDRPSRSTVEENTIHTNIQGFRLRGSIDVALNKTRRQFNSILTTLSEVITNRFEAIIENPIYKAMSIFLDTSTYITVGFEIVVDSMREIAEKFSPQLQANKCNTYRIEDELLVLMTHVESFLENVTPSKAWKVLFKKKHNLGITNVLHIAKICIVSPLGNAEVERIFSLLWRIFCKERCSLSNKVQEDLLRLRGSSVSKDIESYGDAIELFLTEYPDGNVRKRARHISGHKYPKNRKSRYNKKSKINIQSTIHDLVSSSDESDVNSSDSSDSDSSTTNEMISLSEISDDDWSSSDDDEML